MDYSNLLTYKSPEEPPPFEADFVAIIHNQIFRQHRKKIVAICIYNRCNFAVIHNFSVQEIEV